MANQLLIQSPDRTLVRGQKMAVTIVLALDEPLKVRGIHAEFLGAEETTAVYTTTSTDSKGITTVHTHTAVQHEEVTRQVHLLAGNEEMGFFGNMTDAVATVFGAGKHDTLEPGDHQFDVVVTIPDDAPPTHVGEKTRVFYELSVRVDVPAGYDVKATESFQVAPIVVDTKTSPVRTRYPDDAGRGLIDALFGPDVKVEMALVADTYQRDELIEGIFAIEATEPVNCRRIFVQLLGVESSEANGHTDEFSHLSKPLDLALPGTIIDSYKQEFSFRAEAFGPPTASGARFSIKWFVQIQLDVPWAKDPKIRAPFVLLPRL